MRFFVCIIVGWSILAGCAYTTAAESLKRSADIIACTTDSECCDLNPEHCE